MITAKDDTLLKEVTLDKLAFTHICIYVHMHMDPVTRSNWSPACI